MCLAWRAVSRGPAHRKGLDRLPPDWPWYLAVQDGLSLAEVEAALGGLAGIFLGGTDAF
ncbi:MAG: hypothetical protein ACPLRW_01340 [Moorellales bacterium]